MDPTTPSTSTVMTPRGAGSDVNGLSDDLSLNERIDMVRKKLGETMSLEKFLLNFLDNKINILLF